MVARLACVLLRRVVAPLTVGPRSTPLLLVRGTCSGEAPAPTGPATTTDSVGTAVRPAVDVMRPMTVTVIRWMVTVMGAGRITGIGERDA